MLRALPLALLLLSLTPTAAAQTASVSGTVRDAETGETLIQATVVAEGTGLGVATNREGFYGLTGLGAGEVALVVSYVGYEPFRTTLNLGPDERRRLDVALRPSAVEGGEVVVESEAPLEEEKAVGVQNVPIRLIQQIPSAIENDLFRALQLLPGVKAASDFSSRLYIRGGSPDQTLILLDQTTVYNPTHFFGFFSTFNTDAIKDVRVFKGGYPAEYGGRLGSVIDVSNRDGNRNALDGKLSVGLLASRVNAEGPYRLPKALGGAEGSWFLALRRSTLEPLLAALRDSEEFIPDGFYFLDFNGKVNLDLSPNDRLSVSGYAGVDDVDFPFAENARFNLRYGNQTGSVRYTRIFSDRVFSTLRFTGSRYFSFPKAEVAGTEFEQRNTIDDVSAKADVEWLASPQFEVKAGAWGGDLSLRLNNFFDGRETLDSRIESRYFSGYGQATFRPTPAWILTGGLRAAYFSSGDYLRLEPRLSVERKFGERVLAQAAYGRYYQFLTLVSNEAFSAFDVWVTAAEAVPPSYGDQFVLGLKTRPLDNFGADVEVYYRTLRDLFEIDPNLPDVAGLEYADIFRFGEGYATGIEMQLERPKGRLNGFIGYTLALTQRKFIGADGDPVNPDANGEPQYYSPKYDRRHDLSLVANLELGRGWTLTGTFVYATGQAYTRANGRYDVDLPVGSIEGGAIETSGLNRARLPAYHRADLGFTREGSFFGLGDYELRLQTINLYSRRNVWFILTDLDEEFAAQDPVRMLPLLPNVSLTVDF
ncbi:MAG: TonB-dependent receptor [Rhodothermales bacterium]